MEPHFLHTAHTKDQMHKVQRKLQFVKCPICAQIDAKLFICAVPLFGFVLRLAAHRYSEVLKKK